MAASGELEKIAPESLMADWSTPGGQRLAKRDVERLFRLLAQGIDYKYLTTSTQDDLSSFTFSAEIEPKEFTFEIEIEPKEFALTSQREPPHVELTRRAVHAYTGENLADLIGSATLTNTNGVTFTAGKIGNAWTFASASSQALTIGNPDVPSTFYFTTGAWQIAFWFKTTTVAAGDARMFCISDQTGGVLLALWRQDSTVIFTAKDAAGNIRNASTGTTQIATNTWYAARGYFDPWLVASGGLAGGIVVEVMNARGSPGGSSGLGFTVCPGGLNVPTATALAFGRRGGNAADFFDGQIDAPIVTNGRFWSPWEWWRYVNTPAEHPFN